MKIQRSPGLPRGFPIDPKDPTALILRPLGLMAGATARAALVAGIARHLAGGPLAFSAVELFLRCDDAVDVVSTTVSSVQEWAETEGGATQTAVMAQLSALARPRPAIAGLTTERPRLMGIINVTPDSFFDGGRLATKERAVAHGRALRDAGAHILDIGGESTRPGSSPVSEQEEIDRVLPVLEQLVEDGALVSIDTRHASVMRAACAAGARIINDVSALTEPGALEAARDTGAAVVLMHMRGAPRTMQDNPIYSHAPYEVVQYLMSRIVACEAAGIQRDAILVDPGIGFGKSVDHNLQILEQLALLHATGCAVLFGASRKSFIGSITNCEDPEDRLPGSLAAATLAAGQGAQIHRVHDVAETRRALAVVDAINRSGAG